MEASFYSVCSGLQSGPSPTAGVSTAAFLSLLSSALCPLPESFTVYGATDRTRWHYMIPFEELSAQAPPPLSSLTHQFNFQSIYNFSERTKKVMFEIYLFTE